MKRLPGTLKVTEEGEKAKGNKDKKIAQLNVEFQI